MELTGIATAPCSSGSLTPTWQPWVIFIQSTDGISIQGPFFFFKFRLSHPVQHRPELPAQLVLQTALVFPITLWS